MIDCHNHILPGIDDGAHNEAMSIEMAHVAFNSGIDIIVCTPHHLNGVFANQRQNVLDAVASLQKILHREQISITLIPGSELHLVPEIPLQVKQRLALTYGDHGKAALVELPKQTVPSGTINHLRSLVQDGVTPVIAHPERNSTLARSPETLLEWVSVGCKVQLTGQSVSGEFGAAIQRVCDYWIQYQAVHLVASDAHRPRGRKPDLNAALKRVTKEFGEPVAKALFVTNPGHLVNGTDLETAPKPRFSMSNLSTRLRGKVGWL